MEVLARGSGAFYGPSLLKRFRNVHEFTDVFCLCCGTAFLKSSIADDVFFVQQKSSKKCLEMKLGEYFDLFLHKY
jgi:hypothetical protein